MNRPIYRPDFDRVWRAYLTHRRATHYDYRINFQYRVGWDERKRFVDCGVCAVLERQLHQAKPSADPDRSALPASLRKAAPSLPIKSLKPLRK